MLRGDRGLSNFLKDGSGFQGSGYKAGNDNDGPLAGPDPLPWLKLPKLDFVDVAGQEEQRDMLRPRENMPAGSTVEAALIVKLEERAAAIRQALNDGDTAKAIQLRSDLESVCKGTAFEGSVPPIDDNAL